MRFSSDRFDPSVFGVPCYDLDSREDVLQRRYFTINVPLMVNVSPDQMAILLIFPRLRACFDSFRKLFHGYRDVSLAPKHSSCEARAGRSEPVAKFARAVTRGQCAKKKCAPKGALRWRFPKGIIWKENLEPSASKHCQRSPRHQGQANEEAEPECRA